MTWLIWTGVIVLSVLADQLTKLLMVHLIGPASDISQIVVLKDIFQFTYVENPGMAFGTGANARWLFMSVSVVAIVAMLIYLFRFAPKSKWVCTALSLVIGGGIGNMIDRVRLGYVVDFLDFCAFDFWIWVFNVADVFVCVGAGMMLLWCIIELVREWKKERASRRQASTEAASPAEERKETDGPSE